VSMRTGWYDVYLPWMLRDYAALCAAGNPPRLTIGPWGHVSPGLLRGIPRATVDFLSEHLLDAPPRVGGQVRYHVTGANEWRDAETWPPPGGHDEVWSLGPAGELAPAGAAESGTVVSTAPVGSASVFRYDPSDPTPAVGGPSMLADETSVDNRELEQRSDVLVFTSLPLLADLDVIGTPRARLTVSADNPHHDVFVRLCDVHPDGSSMNLGGRLIRMDGVSPGPDGTRGAELELWPSAHRFAAGHRIRVQVSGGAHPRYARNPGTGEPLATATRTAASIVSVHHDARLTSTVTLPVCPDH
jgi:putative CocE/NonD family hydrolase